MNKPKPRNFDTFRTKFWTLVDKSAGPHACWIWLNKPSNNGYGNFILWRHNKSRTYSAHRVAYQLEFGPTGLHVCHTCDNKLCVNPEHLFIGTQSDNMLDKVKKGRNNTQRITTNQVKQIRVLATQGVKHSALAKTFKMSHSNIQHIVKRRSWSWL